MKLSDLCAQETAARVLESCIEKSSVGHAFLFTGPRGCGKTSAALAFAAALNCADRAGGDACGDCLSCRRVEAGEDADVRLISPDGAQTTITQMREMIRALDFAPLSGRHRVFIIEQADTLNPSSENCILKVLEEPPSYAVLILLSSNPGSLLPTIRSRCRTVRFRRASRAELEEALRARFQLSDDQMKTLAACAQGSVGRAFRMASEAGCMEDRQVVFRALRDWAAGPPVLGLQTAELLRSLAAEKKSAKGAPETRTLAGNLTEMLEHILSWYSDLLQIAVRGGSAEVANPDYLDDLTEHASRYNPPQLEQAVRSILSTRRYIEGNVTPQLALENMFFDLQPD